MRKYLAEFTGTFILVICGTGAITINEVSGGVIGHAGIAITFGLVVMAMIYALGDVSGAHLNPAVSFAFFISRRLPLMELLKYSLSQFSGALAASLVLRFLFPLSNTLGATQPSGTDLQSFVLELILSFILFFVIAMVATGAKEKGVMAGIAIGAVVLLEAMFAGPICGASMNPARSFAPALVTGRFHSLWIYFAGPYAGTCLGAVVAAFLCNKDQQQM